MAVRPGDLGHLAMELRVSVSKRRLLLDFGKVIDWVCCPPDEARAIATQMRACVERNFGDLSYDVTTLPIQIEAERETGVVVVTLPTPASCLLVKPEMVLALAQRLDTAAASMID